MRRAALVLAGMLAACGDAPPVQGPPSLGTTPACSANAPPPGYGGPVSPHVGSCPTVRRAAPEPAGVHDYSLGAPPRAVRGQ